MKTTRYQFEQTVQETTEHSLVWLKEELKSILESDREYTRKADYIGYSILSIDSKISVLDEQIKELQSYKTKLKEAKGLVLSAGAEVFEQYGIDKLEGAGISSITVTKSGSKSKRLLHIEDEELLIAAGFYTKVVDEKAVMEAYDDEERHEQIVPYVAEEIVNNTTPAKLKINKRRSQQIKDAA